MKTWNALIFGGVVLAAVISVNSFPASDVTTTKSTAVSSKDESGSVPVPPSAVPISSSSPGSWTGIKNTPLADNSKEFDSKDSDEKTSSTTAKTLFRRQAPEEGDSEESDGGDTTEDEGDDDGDDEEERKKREQPSDYSATGTLSQGGKLDDLKPLLEEQENNGKVEGIATSTTQKTQ